MGDIVSLRYSIRRLGDTLLSALLGAVLACSSSALPSGRPGLVDAAGDTVASGRPARRVVSLIPAATELLFAIGAGPLVVGRTQYCDYPALAQKVPNLGDGIKPSLEAVLAQNP